MVDIKPVMDVSRPGKTPADPSSRPLLVSNKSETTQDPILKHENKPVDSPVESEKPADKPAEGPADISNPAMSAPDSVKKTIEDVPVTEQPATREDLIAPPKKPATDSPESSEPGQETVEAKTDTEAKDETDDSAKKGPKAPAPPAISEDLEKQIQAKTYFVPIGEKSAKRLTRRHMIILVVVVIVVVAAIVLMIDAGLINSSVKLPFDLIKN